MAGNALTGAMFSVGQGNTGVGTKKTTFEAIDEGIKGVKDWKDNIDTQRLKLKTDTADRYREAEKNVKDNLPSDITAKNQALKYLSNYKDMLYNNAQLVRSGNIKPDDNLIFQENGKQSFEILSKQVNGYAEELKKTKERAEGGYFLNEKTGKEEFVNPTSGAYEAAMQSMQSQISSLEGIDVTFSKNGMGEVNFYETEIDVATSTRVLKLDKDGNRIPIKSKSKMNVLALQQGNNQRADRLYMDKEVGKLIGKGSPLGQTYEKMARLGNMSGVVTDDQRANKGLKTLLEDAANNLTATPQRRMSILADNPMVGVNGESVNTKLVPFNEYAQLTDAEKKEMQTYVYTDENGVEQKGTKRKYVELVVKNGNIVPEEDMNDRLAADRSAKSSLYAALQKDISGGSRDSQFDPNSASSRSSKKQKTDDIGRVTLANRIAVGGEDSVQALKEMKTSGIYTIENGFNEVIDVKGEQEIDGRRAMVYEVKTDASGNTEPRYVYITNKDGGFLTQSERVEQSLALIGTNPAQTQNLLDTYSEAGEKLTAVDEDALFSVSTISGGKRVKYEVTEKTDQAIGDIYKASTNNWGSTDGNQMAKDIKSYISNSFKDTGADVPSGLTVTNSSDKTTISAGGITVSSEKETKNGLIALYNKFILAYNNRDKEIDDPKPGGDVTVKKDAFGNIIK